MTIQANDAAIRYSLLREVGQRWGAAARLVLQEFIANTAEHCEEHRVDVSVHRGGLVAVDFGGGFRPHRPVKTTGGYGLTLIRSFGGAVSCWDGGMKLEYRFQADCDADAAERSLRSVLRQR